MTVAADGTGASAPFKPAAVAGLTGEERLAMQSLFVVPDQRRHAAATSMPDSTGDRETLLFAMKVRDGADEYTAKVRFICLAVRKNRVKVHKVKMAKEGDGSAPQIGKSWALDDVRSVESVSPHQLSIYLNKAYTWTVEQPKREVEFLLTLLQLCTQHLKKRPKFIGIDEVQLQGELQTYENRDRLRSNNQSSLDDDMDADNGLSPMEEAMLHLQRDQDDLNVDEVLNDYEWKVEGDAAALESRLINELSALEAANVHAIIQADEQATAVVNLIDSAISELDKIDHWLTLYNTELSTMGKDIRDIESHNKGLQVETANQKALQTDLSKLIDLLAMPDPVLDSLKFDSLEDSFGIKRLEEACQKLQKALQTKSDDYRHMDAYAERMASFGTCSSQFATRLIEFIQKTVQKHVQLALKRSSSPSTVTVGTLNMPSHEEYEEVLLQYRSLISWLQELEPRKFTELQKSYASLAGEMYKKEVRDAIDQVRLFWVAKRASHEPMEYLFGQSGKASVVSALNKNVSVTSMLTSMGHKKTASGVSDVFSNDARSPDDYRPAKHSALRSKIAESSVSLEYTSSTTADGHWAPDKAFKQLMCAIIPVIVRQQNFLTELFSFPGSAPLDTSITQLVANLDAARDSYKDLKASKRVEELMGVLFDGASSALNALIEHSLKLDPTLTLAFLAISETASAELAGTSNSFMLNILDSLQELLTLAFERFMDDQVKAIDETKLTVKKRTGILPFIRTFPLFVQRMESFLKECDAAVDTELKCRTELNRSYERVIKVIFDNLDVFVQESQSLNADDKEQLNAHILALENMHHFYTELRGQKVSKLEPFVKAAKARYETHSNVYIRSVVRRPLSKLLEFFEGIDMLLKTKTPEEVGYHLNYNRASLKKVISAYPGKEVKKSLELLYKRVDKHYCDEEGLLQVIWHGIQEEFIRLHHHFEDLIRRCYPESDLRLAYTIQDLCNYFSDIAKMH